MQRPGDNFLLRACQARCTTRTLLHHAARARTLPPLVTHRRISSTGRRMSRSVAMLAGTAATATECARGVCLQRCFSREWNLYVKDHQGTPLLVLSSPLRRRSFPALRRARISRTAEAGAARPSRRLDRELRSALQRQRHGAKAVRRIAHERQVIRFRIVVERERPGAQLRRHDAHHFE